MIIGEVVVMTCLSVIQNHLLFLTAGKKQEEGRRHGDKTLKELKNGYSALSNQC